MRHVEPWAARHLLVYERYMICFRVALPMGWDTDLESAIATQWKRGETFTLDQVYALAPMLAKKHPGNLNVKAKLRQALQHLRDSGTVQFVNNNGSYKRLK
jgi:hypothetical protein